MKFAAVLASISTKVLKKAQRVKPAVIHDCKQDATSGVVGVVGVFDSADYRLPELDILDEGLGFDVGAFSVPGAFNASGIATEILPSIPSLPTNAPSSSVPSIVATANIDSSTRSSIAQEVITAGTSTFAMEKMIFSPKPEANRYVSLMSTVDMFRDVKATTPSPSSKTCKPAKKTPRTVKEVLDSPSIDDTADYRNVKMPEISSLETVPYTRVRDLMWTQEQNNNNLQKVIKEQATLIAQLDEQIRQLQRQGQAYSAPRPQEPLSDRQEEIDHLRWRLSAEERRLKTTKEDVYLLRDERDNARTRCNELRRSYLEINKRYWGLKEAVYLLQKNGFIHEMERLQCQIANKNGQIAQLENEVAKLGQLLDFGRRHASFNEYVADSGFASEDEGIDTRLAATNDGGTPEFKAANCDAGGYPQARINRYGKRVLQFEHLPLEGADSMEERYPHEHRGNLDAERMFQSGMNND
uniref:Uncharacterized protein n=1 Tax=Moniliophthora roreri TaxID=221103 RepID=A0A0W0F629_MONRR